ncbi:MAG: hypothetical protein D6768_20750 [Chloroflexi bacterium]|nr:MAG: hypothetical protein D6768_20750 [Chloroflexota bacterium]
MSNETISRNIERWGKGSRKVFNCYVDALCAQRVNGVRVEQPLAPDEAKILRRLFDLRRKTRQLQCRLATLDFETIKSGYRPGELTILLKKLQQCTTPAVIIDPLWFIHAINGAALHLFGLSPESAPLNRWVAWHLLAARFRPDSPIRAAHRHADLYYPLTVRYFFEDEGTYPYLFTLQMRLLLSELNRLSQLYGHSFTKWWLQATKFNLPFGREPLIRTIQFNHRQFQIVAGRPAIDQVVTSAAGYRITFRLTGWSPVGEAGDRAFESLRKIPDCQTVYFAADYDRDRSFHVNCWPAANKHIESWIRAGEC